MRVSILGLSDEDWAVAEGVSERYSVAAVGVGLARLRERYMISLPSLLSRFEGTGSTWKPNPTNKPMAAITQNP